MSIKELIKSLTFALIVLPSLNGNVGVKDILNSHTSHFHGQEIITEVQSISFEEHFADGQQIVVVDAGHGGHDPGTHGKLSKEKDIALDIALKLGKILKSSSEDIKVVFTRDKDVFIPLHERIALANKKKADLFISIHCNYVGNPKICGTETFVMGLHRAEDNLKVAKRENSSILLESEYETHYEGYDPNSPVGHILLSMIQNVFIDNSIELASNVEDQFIKRNKTKSRGVKQAGFVVLREATMPSVLIETGFLSNPKEEKYLLSKKGQSEMAEKISNGILGYFKSHFVKNIADNETADRKSEKDEPSTILDPVIDKKYVIQIGAFSKLKPKKFSAGLENYGELLIQEVNGIHKYAVGYYQNKKDAIAILENIKDHGYKDAYIKKID